MSQTSYSQSMTAGMMGMVADSEFTYTVSPNAFENLTVGYGVVLGDTTEDTARLPKATLNTILFDADFVASNTIDLKVNGTSISQVTYASSHDATAAALAAAIDALSGVHCELDTTDTDNRTFLVTTDDAVCAVTDIVVASGVSQAGSTVTSGTDDTFLGVVRQAHGVEQTSAGACYWNTNRPAPILRKGRIWVYVEAAVTELDLVYLRHTTNSTNVPGYFRNDADSGKAMLVSNAKFVKRTTGAGLTVLEVNLP